MQNLDKKFIGICVTNTRKKMNMTQEEFVQDTCSYFTLSRIERGIFNNSFALVEMLNLYDLEVNHLFDYDSLEILYKELLNEILYDDSDKIIAKIHSIIDLCKQYPNHIIMQQYLLYAYQLKVHYIDKELIELSEENTSLLPWFSTNVYLVHFHIIIENRLLFGRVLSGIDFFEKYFRRNVTHVLTDFYTCFYSQLHSKYLKVHNIYLRNKQILEENSYTKLAMKFEIIHAFAFSGYEIKKGTQLLLDLQKRTDSPLYNGLIYFGLGYNYIIQHKFEDALEIFITFQKHSPAHVLVCTPYIALLSCLLEKEMDSKLLVQSHSAFVNNFIKLYELNATTRQYARITTFIVNKILPTCQIFSDRNALIILLNSYVKYLNGKPGSKYHYVKYDMASKKYLGRRSYNV